MEFLKDRRTLLVVAGAVVALVTGLAIAAGLSRQGRGDKTPPPPAATGGLVVEAGPVEDDKLDPARPLRCFVAGQFVGEVTLAECAQRNGVATGALDVGVDEAGNLAAADEAGVMLTPLPPQDVVQPVEAAPVEPRPAPIAAPAGACWRYAGQWQKLPEDLTLDGCVQTLFAGRCERPGRASYGRWMQQTLRLAPGKVEVSGDNRSFRLLAVQGADCAIPPIG